MPQQEDPSRPAGGPLVARWGAQHPSAPLVVLLHGNGTSEHSMIEIAPWLPHGPVAYVAVRAPIQGPTGFQWYLVDDDRGRPDQASLATTVAWFLDWLDTEGDPERPILLLGFREGVTFGGALTLGAPERWAGAVLLYGALPFEAGVPLTRARLAGMPVFLAHGADDPRTPPELLLRTWDWLAKESGAPLWAEREPGGAQLAGRVVAGVATWLGDRLDHLRAHGENPIADGEEPRWPSLSSGRLPARPGAQPDVRPAIPQLPAAQTAPPPLQRALWERLVTLPGVSTAPATVGPPGTRSLLLDRAAVKGPDAAFIVPELGEFAHLHPEHDGSLHVVLPDALAYDALGKGWAVAHPLAGVRVSPGMVLVFGPRDAAELEVVAGVVAAGHAYAVGP